MATHNHYLSDTYRAKELIICIACSDISDIPNSEHDEVAAAFFKQCFGSFMYCTSTGTERLNWLVYNERLGGRWQITCKKGVASVLGANIPQAFRDYVVQIYGCEYEEALHLIDIDGHDGHVGHVNINKVLKSLKDRMHVIIQKHKTLFQWHDSNDSYDSSPFEKLDNVSPCIGLGSVVYDPRIKAFKIATPAEFVFSSMDVTVMHHTISFPLGTLDHAHREIGEDRMNRFKKAWEEMDPEWGIMQSIADAFSGKRHICAMYGDPIRVTCIGRFLRCVLGDYRSLLYASLTDKEKACKYRAWHESRAHCLFADIVESTQLHIPTIRRILFDENENENENGDGSPWQSVKYAGSTAKFKVKSKGSLFLHCHKQCQTSDTLYSIKFKRMRMRMRGALYRDREQQQQEIVNCIRSFVVPERNERVGTRSVECDPDDIDMRRAFIFELLSRMN
jgi:hypothetical protein